MIVGHIGGGAVGVDTGDIEHSLRFRANNSAYLSRTPGSAGNRDTWTWSAWVKRGTLGAAQTIFAAYPSSTVYAYLHFNSSNQIRYASTNSGASLTTTSVYRDPSAWYHIVFVYDDTQATSSNRLKLYVNGVQITAFGTAAYPTQNFGDYINSAYVHNIGRFPSGSEYVDGYLSRICFVDGQALTPDSFGYLNTEINEWVSKSQATCKAVVDAGGTNSFMLDFDNGTSLTTLGYDKSSKGNNWTLNNHSLTAGSSYDWMDDTPTNNFAVLNPLDVSPTESSGRAVFSDGNLTLVGGNQFARGWQIPTSGKWYWEITLVDYYNGSPPLIWGTHGVSSGLHGNVTGVRLWANVNGGIFQDGALVQTFQTWANNDVIGFAYDSGTRSMSVYRNGVQLGTSVTANATDKYVYSFLNGTADTSSVAINFGQRPFAYSPPAGFKALCTKNLPTPSILNPKKHFDATLYTGNGNAGGQSITNSGQFQPDLVWLKGRSAVSEHEQFDSVRGGTKYLVSNNTNAEQTGTGITFNSNGFSLAGSQYNDNALAVVGWQWKAGGAPVTNNAGSIQSQVSANPQAGFSIVTYTGTGANATVGHGLGVAPKMVITKRRTAGATGSWGVGHLSANSGAGFAGYLTLETSDAFSANATQWNSTAPSSTVFTLGTGTISNTVSINYVAYCIAEIPGYSKIGSYTGNGSADGPFVYCGFRPRFVLIKRVDTTGNWRVVDTSRSTYNANGLELYPNLPNAEGAIAFDFLSNGIKPRLTDPDYNASGGSYIFYAVAEQPFQFANAR